MRQYISTTPPSSLSVICPHSICKLSQLNEWWVMSVEAVKWNVYLITIILWSVIYLWNISSEFEHIAHSYNFYSYHLNEVWCSPKCYYKLFKKNEKEKRSKSFTFSIFPTKQFFNYFPKSYKQVYVGTEYIGRKILFEKFFKFFSTIFNSKEDNLC